MSFRLPVLAGLLISLASLQVAAAPVVSDGLTVLTVEDLKQSLVAVSPQIRTRITADKVSLGRFAATLMQDRRIATAAKESGFAESADMKAVMEKVTRDALVSRYLDDLLARDSKSAPDFRSLAKEQFEINRKDYFRPEAVRIAHILIPVDVEDERFAEDKMRAKANEVLARLRAGEDFAKLAKEFSGDRGTAGQGGELAGWVERDKMVPPFEKAAFALKPGELSDLVRTRFGFHVIKKLDYRPAQPIPFSEMELQLIAKQRAEYQNGRRSELLRQFAGEHDVEIDDEVLKQLKPNY